MFHMPAPVTGDDEAAGEAAAGRAGVVAGVAAAGVAGAGVASAGAAAAGAAPTGVAGAAGLVAVRGLVVVRVVPPDVAAAVLLLGAAVAGAGVADDAAVDPATGVGSAVGAGAAATGAAGAAGAAVVPVASPTWSCPGTQAQALLATTTVPAAINAPIHPARRVRTRRLLRSLTPKVYPPYWPLQRAVGIFVPVSAGRAGACDGRVTGPGGRSIEQLTVRHPAGMVHQ